MDINNEKLSAIISLIVAIIVVGASYFQWWHITYNGGMVTKTWVKILLGVLIVGLATALFLIVL